MRTAILLALLLLSPCVVWANDSDDTLRFYLSKSELTIVSQVLDEPIGLVHEAGVVNYVCRIRVIERLAGVPTQADNLRVNIVRFAETGGVPEKDAKYILFLTSRGQNVPAWETTDFWFGIQPYHRRTAVAIKRIADMMAEEARWRTLRQLGNANKPEDIPKLMEIAKGRDREVVMAAISRLSNFSSNPEITAFLRKKMDDPDPHIALEAAIVSCYSGDWSGFEMLLAHVTHKEPKLRLAAIAQLGDSQFRRHRGRIVPSLLDRLRNETDPALLERAIEWLGTYPSKEVLAAIQPYLKHENEQVRTRAELVVRVMKGEMTIQDSEGKEAAKNTLHGHKPPVRPDASRSQQSGEPIGRPEDHALGVLETFLGALASKDFKVAYALVAPRSKKRGDPIAYRAPLDYKAFLGELSPHVDDDTAPSGGLRKFMGYELGDRRWESPDRFRVLVTFQGWDNDEVLIVQENGKWYVADPIHIIR